jgi:hypothetical protein
MADILPEVCPPECARAHFQAVLPEVWPGPGRPVVLQLAGTGDHFFWRRRTLMAKPLVKERGVGSILLGTFNILQFFVFFLVLRIRDILVRIWISGSVSLTDGFRITSFFKDKKS